MTRLNERKFFSAPTRFWDLLLRARSQSGSPRFPLFSTSSQFPSLACDIVDPITRCGRPRLGFPEDRAIVAQSSRRPPPLFSRTGTLTPPPDLERIVVRPPSALILSQPFRQPTTRSPGPSACKAPSSVCNRPVFF